MSSGAVYDCMIFLQAAANPHRLHSTFRLVDSGKVTLYVSGDILAEIRDVLTRPAHRIKFPALTPEHVSDFLAATARQSTLIDEVPMRYEVKRDPKDSKYVNLAIAVGALHLVSWDRHLLELMDETTPEGRDFRQLFPGIRILDPVSFVRMFDGK